MIPQAIPADHQHTKYHINTNSFFHGTSWAVKHKKECEEQSHTDAISKKCDIERTSQHIYSSYVYYFEVRNLDKQK